MKELYRSFEGKLNVENQTGYIIYATSNGLLEIEELSVLPDAKTHRYRIPADLLPETDYANVEKIGALTADLWFGLYENGQIFFNGKWFSGKTISRIQQKNRDKFWQRYV